MTSHSDCQGDPPDDNREREANAMNRRCEQKVAPQPQSGNQENPGKAMQRAKSGEQNAHPVEAIANQGNGCTHDGADICYSVTCFKCWLRRTL